MVCLTLAVVSDSGGRVGGAIRATGEREGKSGGPMAETAIEGM